MQPKPDPECQCIQMPSDLNSQSGLDVIHLNVHSLLPKMDMVRIGLFQQLLTLLSLKHG